MKLLIHELASLAYVSVRTLHYYDEIGLLKPSEISSSGYRYYCEDDVKRLKKILYYKELDLPLREIKRLIDSSLSDSDTLKRHKLLLELKRERLNKIINSLEENIKGEGTMSFDEFDMKKIDDAMSQYSNEVTSRWNNTSEYKESSKRTQNYTAEKWKKIKSEDDEIIFTFASLINTVVTEDKAKETVKRWQDHISRYYYPCSDEILSSLGAMYVADERFIATLDRFKKGTALYMSEAITSYVKNK
ncbi:MAG: MerR family transcriptional regulator [Spirochaetia bacterium]|nr:MerR family transcriptional regulator [Spirochaetia bacterium]